MRPNVVVYMFSATNWYLTLSGPQVNLKSCCVVPEELSTFAKTHKVALLTHSDPQVPS